MGTVISRYIPLQGLNNTRDLGGMRTKDGRTIKSGKLIRSGRLNGLEDKQWFSENVGLIVDFRSSREIVDNPEPAIESVEYIHLPIFEMRAAGVTRDRESDRRMTALDPESAIKRMASVYVRFVTDEFCLYQYRRFIRMLLEPREKAVLWHCSAGKDRTGTGAIFVQEMLGVGREDIFADYMITNEYIEEEVRQQIEERRRQTGSMDEAAEKVMRSFIGAHEEYPATVYETAEKQYGTFDAFIEKALDVTCEDREQFRQMYLED